MVVAQNYVYMFRSNMKNNETDNLENSDSDFVNQFKVELNEQLQILGTPVSWHRRWRSAKSTGEHTCSFKVNEVYYV